ncbi:MAG: hypothetical protein CO108_25320 [Deltaproteobacteria bacterium CG_4_9_14_3_um_filter_63_12]|nr:MAG: hypothetical protein CO108_25320 [Deltaproteobacteria bacterium CG_4_9_14_3_um_filter_63_12]
MSTRRIVARSLFAVAAFTALSGLATSAWATPPLMVPWPCGTTYSVTQGHNTGSHTAEGSWAWDFGIPVGAEVAAPAAGQVRRMRMDSTRSGCDAAYANDANYVIVDFGDGTEALFLHLQANSSSLQVGQSVQAGQVVGRVGLSGWVCGAHLHFQIQNTCASWWCQSIAASFVGFGNPGLGTPLTSDNCGAPVTCDARLNGGTTLIDELDTACFSRATQWWWDVAEGYDGHHFYTFATDAAAADTVGRWSFGVDVAGDYRVEAFIPNNEAESQQARYQLATGPQTPQSRLVNQATEKGWVDLGVYSFTNGDARFVSLADNTGENYDALKRKLAYDAVRLTWVPPVVVEPEPQPEGSDDVADVAQDQSQTDASEPSDVLSPPDLRTDAAEELTSSDVSADLGPSDTQSTVDADSGGIADPSRETVEGACGCHVASPRREDFWLGLGMGLGLLGLVRRRLS